MSTGTEKIIATTFDKSVEALAILTKHLCSSIESTKQDKRFIAACSAMTGLLSGRELDLSKEEADMVAVQSFQFADSLLEKEAIK
jgi:hypothetical protein